MRSLSSTTSRSLPRQWPLWTVAAIIILSVIVRARLLAIPLERDEGEYAYAGQLILRGVPPYELVYNMKFPGTYYAYALVLAVFGQTPEGVHLGLLVVNAATILVVFLLGRRLFDPPAGVGAAAAFAVLSLSPSVGGLFAHATHFVLLPALAGLLLLLRALDGGSRRLLISSGVLLGMAVLMKQHGVVFLFFAFLVVAWTRLRKPTDGKRCVADLVTLGAGAAIPLVSMAAILVASGVFGRFWLWTFTYASEYVSQRSWSGAPGYLVNGIRNAAGTAWPIWGLAIVGLALLMWDETWRQSRFLVVCFLCASFVGTVPGFYFRRHYFILMLPAIALLAGAAPVAAARLLARKRGGAMVGALCASVLVIALGVSIRLDAARLFRLNPKQLMREIYHQNPFPEAIEVADYLRTHTGSGETIAVFGSEPEIFFYARRPSATGYIYMYPLTERHKLAESMRLEMLREIQTARPRYAVFVGVNSSWIDHSPADTSVPDKMMAYAQANYDAVGLFEILTPEHTEVRWEGALAGYAPRSPYRVIVLRRRDVSRD